MEKEILEGRKEGDRRREKSGDVLSVREEEIEEYVREGKKEGEVIGGKRKKGKRNGNFFLCFAFRVFYTASHNCAVCLVVRSLLVLDRNLLCCMMSHHINTLHMTPHNTMYVYHPLHYSPVS